MAQYTFASLVNCRKKARGKRLNRVYKAVLVMFDGKACGSVFSLTCMFIR